MRGYEQLTSPPEHVIQLMLGLLRSKPTAGDPLLSARCDRRTATEYATRVWAEAAHVGAVWGMARVPLQTVAVSSRQLAEFKEWRKDQ